MKLKKIMAFSAVAGVFTLAACGKTNATTTATETPTTTVAPTTTEEGTKALSFEEYIAAANDTEVTICASIQDRCTWYNNAASFYLEDEDGGYYVYNLACTEEEYAKLTAGVTVQITGMKSEWKGEVEINYGTATENQGWKIIEGEENTYGAHEVADIATATLDEYKNRKVAVNELTVTKAAYAMDKEGKAIELTPAAGTDVYFDVTDGVNTLTFVVEAYLYDTQFGSDTYNAVVALKTGDKINLEGYVYYYNAPQLQVTSVTENENTYADYMATDDGNEVTITGYIQDRCTWYNNAASFYLADNDGGYYVYNLACTEEEYTDMLVPGTYISVTGAKSTWKGETEINYGTTTENQNWQLESDATKIYDAITVADIATATLDQYKNQKVATGELTVTKAAYAMDKESKAIELTPATGADIYFDVTDGVNTLTFVVEAYLEETQYGSDTYNAVVALKAGDKITLEGFIYYYNAPQMQVTAVTKK